MGILVGNPAPCTEPFQSELMLPGLFSFMSICSPAGRAWLADRCVDSRYKYVVDLLPARQMRKPGGTLAMCAERAPEPDRETALAYTQGEILCALELHPGGPTNLVCSIL